MAKPGHRIWIFGVGRRAAVMGLGFAIVFGLAAGTLAHAQTFSVLHTFGGGENDGALPYAGVTMDAAGNLYGTTYNGGPIGFGMVYKLTRRNGNWTLAPLHAFDGFGGFPKARVVIGPNGTLYGTTSGGEGGSCDMGCGIVFNLKPPPTIPPAPMTPWVFTLLYIFEGGADGGSPQFGDLVFDATGAMYGTTLLGGTRNLGVVYKLAPSGQGYVESVLHNFIGADDGNNPYGSVLFDSAGNLYTTASQGGANFGTVVELTPSGGGWTETTIYSFLSFPNEDGQFPRSGLIFDRSGNLYGTTYSGYPFGDGTVFELTPSGGGWSESVLHGFKYFPNHHPAGPESNLVMDAAGNLYGTSPGNGVYGWGNVFELTPSNGGWAYRDIYDFTGGSDGAVPTGTLTLDANGNIYGTASLGGTSCNCGVVWEIQMQ